MGSRDTDHQQTALTEDFDRGTDADESESCPEGELQELINHYLTAQRTTGSQAYANTAASVLILGEQNTSVSAL